MARKFTLQPLLDLAQTRVDSAARTLRALELQVREAEEKLRQLQEYQESYRSRLQDASGRGMTVGALRDFGMFMAKLDAAIKVQQEEIDRCKGRWEAAQGEWLTQRRELKAYDTLSQRHYRAEAKKTEKIEQREQDEFAGKLFERSRPGENESGE